ncbi:MAG: orotidine-5'-phosphate decarboxylase [Candidatus Omnitrophica bacterium]|jgi:orotidine-5'-phosphate decarboxylase|nr:orotidine-5'-phosphate decarboxylase [Candidatus Omnitrophota bacterium]
MTDQRLPWGRLIVALDLGNEKEIEKVVEILAPKKAKFKIGSIAFTKFGPALVQKFTKKNIDIFVDLKLYDIPNTMKETARVITEIGCWAFTVHIKAGADALAAVRDEVKRAAEEKNIRKPLILGVTELTSSKASPEDVLKLVTLANDAKLDGVIASAQEAPAIKAKFDNLKVITPGIRSPFDAKGDQQRITTAKTAFESGADYIVVGRPIISKKDYLKAAEEVLSA